MATSKAIDVIATRRRHVGVVLDVHPPWKMIWFGVNPFESEKMHGLQRDEIR